MNYNSQSISKYYSVQETLTVSKEISALELISTNNGARSRKITPVPKGACLQVCGHGFNERTIQVRWEGKLCYVFLQDVEPVEVFSKFLQG
jgi:hypothetical protein